MKIEYENDNVKKSLEQFALAEIKTTLNKIEKKLKGFNPKKPSKNFRYLKG
jgi:hypothetical protein